MFSRNFPALSHDEQQLLQDSHVLVLGCGGLGGFITENLVRLGVGHICAADGDCFEPGNLNRQILATSESMGKNKALAARERALSINPAVNFRAEPEFFTAENADELLQGADLVLDALDNIPARLLLEQKCAERGLSIVHGAVSGWLAQVAVVPPGSGVLTRLYSGAASPQDKSCLAFAPAFCAALQCAEAVKLLCRPQSDLEGRLLTADLQSMEINFFTL